MTTLSWSEIVSEFVEGSTEALRGSEAFKTQHGIVTLFDSAVILLDSIILIAAAPMLYLLPEHFGHGPRIGVVTIGGHLFGTASGDGWGTAEEALGGCHISFGTEHRVDQLPLFVNGPIPINPPATHLYIGLIYIPTAADSALPSAPYLVSQQRSKPLLLVPHGFITELITTNQKQLHQVAQTQFE
jgi:hypothetical protein